ncbi:MAP kinase-activating death domain protein-like [Saccostrea cucullata]|uniref:MAP kinase-activating death domain protein-like n=1 Tax=Saccostrea cuccullata TaxID=36930 RepID=UPI002ED00819
MPPRAKKRRMAQPAATATQQPSGSQATVSVNSQTYSSTASAGCPVHVPIPPTQAPSTSVVAEAQPMLTTSAGPSFAPTTSGATISTPTDVGTTPAPVPSIHMIVGQIPTSSSTCQGTPLPSAPIFPQHHLQSEFAKLLDASVSENTHKSHRAGMAAYYKCSRSNPRVLGYKVIAGHETFET